METHIQQRKRLHGFSCNNNNKREHHGEKVNVVVSKNNKRNKSVSQPRRVRTVIQDEAN